MDCRLNQLSGTHEEVVVVLLAHASGIGAAGDREGHGRAEHKRAHCVARHLNVFATLRIVVTSLIDSFTTQLQDS